MVDFQFGVGENAHHLLLELYASGNVILTGANYNILTLLRSHRSVWLPRAILYSLDGEAYD